MSSRGGGRQASALPSGSTSAPCRVTLHRVSDRSDLEADWRALEVTTDAPIFLRWLWVGSWLDCYEPRVTVARVELDGATIALGLFTEQKVRRHGVLPVQRLLLHQTGRRAEDQLWIEYNGLLARPEHAAMALGEVLAAFIRAGRADEIFLSMLPGALADSVQEGQRFVRETLHARGYSRDLAAVRRSGDSLLMQLASNTRQQLRRSLRHLEARHGPAKITDAASVDEALLMLREAGVLHRARWADSGFANPAFVAFHELLIKRGFDHGNVRLCRFSCGAHRVGVFYFLADSGTVYFYLQGVQPEADGKLKPGLTGHWLLMQHFLEQGFDNYDFMGGDSQYKRQLADRDMEFRSLQVHGGACKLRVEDALRRVRGRLWRR